MRVHEFIFELADKPAQFKITHRDDDVCEVSSPELGLTLYITRGISNELKNNMLYIEFAVNNQYHITGKGNSIKILSTVIAMISSALPKFMRRTDDFVIFSAEKSEPSRVSLYNRAVPKITNILQTLDYAWKFKPVNDPNSGFQRYTWEREMG